MPPTGNEEPVILVHGLYLGPWAMTFLARQLARSGYRPLSFAYGTVRETPARAAGRLAGVAARQPGPVCHFVGHSLGGLVLRHLFHDARPARPGRVVSLGTPHRGSRVGEVLAARRLGWMLGSSRHGGVLGDVPPWVAHPEHPLGVIAGSRPVGLGRFIGGLGPSDGTVAVSETPVEGMSDYLLLPVSHISMLLSREVARQVVAFLREGRFAEGA